MDIGNAGRLRGFDGRETRTVKVKESSEFVFARLKHYCDYQRNFMRVVLLFYKNIECVMFSVNILCIAGCRSLTSLESRFF